MKNEELNIITRILSGKTDEFTYFLDTYGQQVYSLIVRIVRSEADAEELTQDTFMKCFENLSSFNAKSSFSTWLYRIAYNTAISFTRKKEPEVNVYDEKIWNTISDTEIDETMNDESEENINKLYKALTMLQPDERALITLFYEQEKTIQEIQQILNVKESFIKVKLHRIRKKLYIKQQIQIISELKAQTNVLEKLLACSKNSVCQATSAIK